MPSINVLCFKDLGTFPDQESALTTSDIGMNNIDFAGSQARIKPERQSTKSCGVKPDGNKASSDESCDKKKAPIKNLNYTR